MSTAAWVIAALAGWVAICLIVARVVRINSAPGPSDDAQIDSIRAQLDLANRDVKERSHVRAGK